MAGADRLIISERGILKISNVLDMDNRQTYIIIEKSKFYSILINIFLITIVLIVIIWKII